KRAIRFDADQISVASSGAEFLIEQGDKTTIWSGGALVVEQVRKTAPDLVLLDIMLPGQDGISVCRDLSHFYKAPIIMLPER
ncbi:DNA-binding response regulator, partial [Pseudoalteromonas sp. S4389]|uniref:response regulator n=1 Tax=Pseudoalteromonas sp. S4389 TaxID=579556 RepID=UPI001109DDCE